MARLFDQVDIRRGTSAAREEFCVLSRVPFGYKLHYEGRSLLCLGPGCPLCERGSKVASKSAVFAMTPQQERVVIEMAIDAVPGEWLGPGRRLIAEPWKRGRAVRWTSGPSIAVSSSQLVDVVDVAKIVIRVYTGFHADDAVNETAAFAAARAVIAGLLSRTAKRCFIDFA